MIRLLSCFLVELVVFLLPFGMLLDVDMRASMLPLPVRLNLSAYLISDGTVDYQLLSAAETIGGTCCGRHAVGCSDLILIRFVRRIALFSTLPSTLPQQELCVEI